MEEATASANGQENDKKLISFLQGFQKHFFAALFSGIVAAGSVSVVFYFKTNYTLMEQSQELNLINKRIDAHDAKIESMQTDLTTIKSQMLDVKESQDKEEQDMKRIYDILLGMKK